MLTGKRFTISKATVALEATETTRSLVTVPQGSIIEITSGPSGHGMGTVAVLWGDRTLAMFAIDIEKRGTEIEDRTGAQGPKRYTPGVVEVYKRETKEIIRRFLIHQLSFPNCIAGLDAALAGVLPRLQPDQLDEVRAVMLANNATVMEEMQKRGQINNV